MHIVELFFIEVWSLTSLPHTSQTHRLLSETLTAHLADDAQIVFS